LRGCKFSLERTKSKFDLYYTIKAACPDWFEKWDPEDPKIKEMLSLGIYLPLQGFDKHGRKVLMMRGGKMDPIRFDLIDQVLILTKIQKA
jgi:hypothetical protein